MTLSKRTAAALLNSDTTTDLEKSTLFNKKDKEYILHSLRQASARKIDQKEAWEKVERSIGKHTERRVYLKYAAAIVLLITSIFIITSHFNNSQKGTTIHHLSQITPGSDKAILSLENGKELILGQETYKDSIGRISNGKSLVYKKDSENHKLIYNYITIPRGGQFEVQLADGTKVWLNADSKLKYPVKFKNGSPREVELLYGEAYFEVSPSEDHNGDSFSVQTHGQSIEVLGTSFNVKAYESDGALTTTLVEGEVALVYGENKKHLSPNQQAVYDLTSQEVKITNVDVYNDVSWKNGVFSFKDKRMKEIMTVLSRWYNVEIQFENKSLEDVKFTGAINKKQSIESILLLIKNINDIAYEVNNNMILIK